MSNIKTLAENAVQIAAAAPAIVAAIAVSTTEDVIRGVIAVVVVAAIVYQTAIAGHASDPWLQSIATVLIGYYFGLATGIARSVTDKQQQSQATPKAQTKK